jgi:predicted nucleotide-binding protein (sugar kinase/HSP70/actin superfamily)
LQTEKNTMPSLAIQPWGNYCYALAASVECLRVTPWTSPSSTPEMLQLGAEAAPEFSCLSFKASTGHFIKAAQEGVEYGVMVNSVGTCRLRYYRTVQQKILRDRGLDLFIFGLGYDGIKPPLIRHFDPDAGPFLRCCARAFWKVKTIDTIEEAAWRTRAIETRHGDTTRVMNQALQDLDRARRVPEILAVRKTIADRFARVPVDTGREPLKVGLLGEATVLRDKYLNHNIEEALGSMGVEVRNFFLMGAEIRNIFHIGFRSKHSRATLKQLARPYLKSLVGGHALDSVAHTIRCAKEGYDGIVHVCPTGCMPEISIRPILRKVSQDMDIPVLECSFDEHTSHVGVVTRLEAFIDILLERRKKKSA